MPPIFFELCGFLLKYLFKSVAMVTKVSQKSVSGFKNVCVRVRNAYTKFHAFTPKWTIQLIFATNNPAIAASVRWVFYIVSGFELFQHPVLLYHIVMPWSHLAKEVF